MDVEGWRGDNFPFTFNIADYNVVVSESVHLPPTVHLSMQAGLPKACPAPSARRGTTATWTTTRFRFSTAAISSVLPCRPG
jgi:hypothetical protein